MKRPSIALCAIFKNEARHMERFLKSFGPYVDAVYLTDTGSSDGSREIAIKNGAIISDFAWINDFAAARNFNFSQAKEDFIMWADLDDALENPEAFVRWRDHAMGMNNYWFVNYHYALDPRGNPVVTFARERVVERKRKFEWAYFVHEGIVQKTNDGQPLKVNQILTWAIKHLRTAEDVAGDRSRNLKIFEDRMKFEKLNSRMQFYYGKELFDNEKFTEAAITLAKASCLPDQAPHDRILAVQYAAFSLLRIGQYQKAIELCQQGMMLDPNRAEFWVVLGDSMLAMQNLRGAIPMFNAAISCAPVGTIGMSPLYAQKNIYGEYPHLQLSKIYFNLGDVERSEYHAKMSSDCGNDEAKKIYETIQGVKKAQSPSRDIKKTDDIVFTCPPQQVYPFDPDIEKQKGVGGSETALIHMAKYIKKHTGRPVKVFTQRDNIKEFDGVEYIPTIMLNEYFAKNEPRIHIAWRHNIKLTDAKTYVWSHDLITPGINNWKQYDKLLCLSNFHKNYAMAMQGVPEEKIHITRNGIVPARFSEKVSKIPGKVIFSSSPDRGLERVIKLCEMARPECPELNLHIFYGTDNLRKFGHAQEADRLENLMKGKDWITYHGNVQQDVLTRHFKESVVWLYPSDFIETFCISVLEAMCSGTYGIMRSVGALQDTGRFAAEHGMAKMIDHDCQYPEEWENYKKALVDAIKNNLWQNVSVDAENYGWEQVAKEWIKDLL